MDRSLYPEGVEVHQRDLERTETTKSFHVRQRHIDTTVMGVVSGCEVTINGSSAVLIDIASGSGYTPNGEYIEVSSASTQSLADYANGVDNYVLAVYYETNLELQPHETNGESYPTSAIRSSRLVILTETEYNALSDTDDNLNNNAKDRALILAIVTAKGTGVSLTSNDVALPTIFDTAITASKTNNITGVSLITLSRNTESGTGILSYTSATQRITWQAPDDTNPGASQVISTSGTYTLKSSTISKTITILVVSSLPGSNATDNVTISNIYAQDISRLSSEDIQHRGLLGSGIPTTTNPHGLTLVDLGATSEMLTHQDRFHANGILKESAADVLKIEVDVF